MKTWNPLFILPLVLMSCGGNQEKTTNDASSDSSDVVVDTYFGTEVEDPYRWLEDDYSERTKKWVKEQNEITFSYLEEIPFREELRQRLEELWNYEKVSAPFKEGKYKYYFKNDGLQNQSVMYKIDESGNEEVFLDPNTFSEDGTTSLGGMEFSEDGNLMCYAISEGGSDWRKVIVMDVETKEIVEDTLMDIKFSGLSWYKNEGFYYSSYDKPEGSELSAKTDQHKLYYHELGTSQKEDPVIFGEDVKRRYVSGSVSHDNRFLFITAANETSGNELYMQRLENGLFSEVETVVDHYNNDVYVMDNKDDQLFIVTNMDAPNKRIVTVSAEDPRPAYWKDLIPEKEFVLSPSKGGGYIFAHYMKDALSVVEQYDYEGNMIREIELPGLGTASGFGGKKDAEKVYYRFANYTTPTTIYELNIKSGKSKVYKKPNVAFNSDDYTSEQVFYTSKDGTKIPMIITYKKGLEKNGKNPTMLYGYGGFNISLTPRFSVENIAWLEQGGIYAVANLRGGGEYGKEWHKAGTQMQKQNVFDDFIAAGEYLIDQNFTSSEYLAIHGRSNGGLLVGAVMTQRPDLMQVALPGVGVLDMLRYHTFTAGAGWSYDYGTSEDSKEMFEYLLAYSPVHNVEEGVDYPATMVTTADHDDRVVPAHSFKFAAQLRDKHAGEDPVMIRIDVNAGHGAGKPISMTIQEKADMFAFTFYNMGFEELPSKEAL